MRKLNLANKIVILIAGLASAVLLCLLGSNEIRLIAEGNEATFPAILTWLYSPELNVNPILLHIGFGLVMSLLLIMFLIAIRKHVIRKFLADVLVTLVSFLACWFMLLYVNYRVEAYGYEDYLGIYRYVAYGTLIFSALSIYFFVNALAFGPRPYPDNEYAPKQLKTTSKPMSKEERKKAKLLAKILF